MKGVACKTLKCRSNRSHLIKGVQGKAANVKQSLRKRGKLPRQNYFLFGNKVENAKSKVEGIP